VIRPLRAAVLELVSDQDERLMAMLPGTRIVFTEAKVGYTERVCPCVGHAFFNDTNGNTYDEETAVDAWHRTPEFFRAHRERVTGRRTEGGAS
jgi:carboxymethylenebutenolidase